MYTDVQDGAFTFVGQVFTNVHEELMYWHELIPSFLFCLAADPCIHVVRLKLEPTLQLTYLRGVENCQA